MHVKVLLETGMGRGAREVEWDTRVMDGWIAAITTRNNQKLER